MRSLRRSRGIRCSMGGGGGAWCTPARAMPLVSHRALADAAQGGGGGGMAQLKELRARTGAGVLDCKEAISAAGGDLAKAERWLLDKARGRFLKKADRPTTEGTLALATHPALDAALLFELNSETDFVGRLEGFQRLAHQAAVSALAHSAESSKAEGPHALAPEWLASLPLDDGSARNVEDGIVSLFMQVGENMKARRGVLLRTLDRNGVVGTFIQGVGLPNTGTLAAMISLRAHVSSDKPAREALVPLANLLAKHIAGSNPKCLSLEGTPSTERIERQDVLLDQELSVGEQTGRVRDVLESESMKVGGRIELAHFVRWKVGDGLEKPVTDFAAEVEKELQRSSKH